jgi:hypothetical protein
MYTHHQLILESTFPVRTCFTAVNSVAGLLGADPVGADDADAIDKHQAEAAYTSPPPCPRYGPVRKKCGPNGGVP